MIVNGDDVRRARLALGWSIYELGAALRFQGGRDGQGRAVRDLESGRRPVAGPTAVAVEAFASGWRPSPGS